MNLQRLFLSLCIAVLSITIFAAIPANCDSTQQAKGYPEYYCHCKYDYTNFQLPLDTIVSYEQIWLKGWVSDLYDGLSAYLHSDCDLNFEIYTSCSAKTPTYTALFAQNQANALDGEAIKRKLQENQVGNMDIAFYICISPIAGNGGRLIMRTQNDGMPSTCDDPLHIFPGMSLYTTQTNDVYVVDPNQLYEITDIILHWEPDAKAACQLQVTQSTCDGPTIVDTTLNADDIYILSADQVKQAKDNNQQLYLHVNHAANTAGMFHCLAPEYEEYYIDTLLCQGMGLQVHDTLLTEPTVYTVDTVHEYANLYTINFYDLSFYEPDLEYDTLAFQYTQQPYLYRGQHTINQPGTYDLTIHTPGQCDERYMLHVYHDIDTLVHATDTMLCYGSSFSYEGKIYLQDVSFGKAIWKNQDTLILDTLNVYFANIPEMVFDTIAQNTQKYGKTFKQTGDFRFTYTNPATFCVDSIILHVKTGDIKYDYYYVDTTLCQGKVYQDYYGNQYTSSVVLYDTTWRVMNKHCEVEIITVTFTEPEIQHDTISLKTTQLPYKYNKYCTVDSLGIYDYTIHVAGKCDERYQLLVLHDIDTLYQSVDTTLCQGKIYQHNEVEYTTSATLLDTIQLDADTYQILTTKLQFAAPEQQYDTLSLKTTDMPYTYRGQYAVTGFGNHDVMITGEDVCDEHYLLYVEHDIDTLYVSVDTTLCQGKVYQHNAAEYTTDVTLMDTLLLDADTYQILITNVQFSAPEQQYDTLSLKTTDLPYTYRGQYVVNDFGAHDVLITSLGTCDEHYSLLVLHDIDTLYQVVDTVLCQGKSYLHNGVEYTTNITFVEMIRQDADTYKEVTTHLSFTAPEVQYDTIGLRSTDLPYTYREQYSVGDFGNHDVVIAYPNTCDERYMLHVYHDIDTLVLEQDTLLCYGKAFVYDAQEYHEDTTLYVSSWLNVDTLQIDILNVYFASTPDQVYDTLSLKANELPYTYREQQIPAFGDYEFLLYNEEGCQEQVYLSVVENKNTTNLDDIPLYDRPQLIMRDGVVYVLRGSQCFTLLGQPTCIELEK